MTVELGYAHIAECTLHYNVGCGHSQEYHGAIQQNGSHTGYHVDEGTGEFDVPEHKVNSTDRLLD